MFARLSFFSCLSLGFLAFALPASAATLFSENFTGDTVGQTTGTWRGFNTINVTGTAYGASGVTTGSAAPTAELGNSYLYAQNNSSPNNATTTVDYFLFSTTATAGAGLFTGLTPTNYADFTVSWQQNVGGSMVKNSVTMSYYFTVQVNGNWYATPSGSASVPAQNLYSIDLLNATWYPVAFNQGTSMSLNTSGGSQTSSSLFAGGQSITGVGYYIKDLPGANPTVPGPPVIEDYRTIRFDNLAINGTGLVPEPGRAFLLALSLGLFGIRRRR